MALNGLLIKHLQSQVKPTEKKGKRKEKRNIEVVRFSNRYPWECKI